MFYNLGGSENMETVYNPLVFANSIIEHSFDNKNYLTVNKLNALVYLSTIESMKTYESKQPLFAENFNAHNAHTMHTF